jgi:hypothetical protein
VGSHRGPLDKADSQCNPSDGVNHGPFLACAGEKWPRPAVKRDRWRLLLFSPSVVAERQRAQDGINPRFCRLLP